MGFKLLGALALVVVLCPSVWAAAPPECATDEECVGMGYDYCDLGQMDGVCVDEDAADLYECTSDAGCGEGEICVEVSSASYCEPEIPSNDADTAGDDASTGSPSGDATGADQASTDSGGCAGGGPRSPVFLALLMGLALVASRRRATGFGV